MLLIKSSIDGQEIFTKTFGGTGIEQGESVIQTSDGGFLLLGSTLFEGNSMITLTKTNSEGELEK